MAKLIHRLFPIAAQRQVVHGEGGVAGDLALHLEEGRQRGHNLLILQRGEGFQKDQVPAPGMARRLVHVELVLLVLDNNKTSVKSRLDNVLAKIHFENLGNHSIFNISKPNYFDFRIYQISPL